MERKEVPAALVLGAVTCYLSDQKLVMPPCLGLIYSGCRLTRRGDTVICQRGPRASGPVTNASNCQPRTLPESAERKCGVALGVGVGGRRSAPKRLYRLDLPRRVIRRGNPWPSLASLLTEAVNFNEIPSWESRREVGGESYIS